MHHTHPITAVVIPMWNPMTCRLPACATRAGFCWPGFWMGQILSAGILDICYRNKFFSDFCEFCLNWQRHILKHVTSFVRLQIQTLSHVSAQSHVYHRHSLTCQHNPASTIQTLSYVSAHPTSTIQALSYVSAQSHIYHTDTLLRVSTIPHLPYRHTLKCQHNPTSTIQTLSYVSAQSHIYHTDTL
jgi:hypothetical protein